MFEVAPPGSKAIAALLEYGVSQELRTEPMLSSPIVETQSNLLPTKNGGGGATLAIDSLPCQRIFRASLASSLSLSGSDVLSWRDQLGGELPLVSNVATYSATGGPSNGPYVTKPSGQTLGFGTLPFTQTPFSLYAVVKTPTATQGSPLITFGFNNGQTGPYYPTDYLGYIYTGIDPYYSASVLTQPRTSWQLVSVRMRDADSFQWNTNDEPAYPWQQNGSGTSAYSITALSLFMSGIQCAELRVLPYYVSDADHQAIKTQLVNQYALADVAKSTMLIGDSHMSGVQAGASGAKGNPFWRNLRANNVPIAPVYLPGACANNNNGVGDFPDIVDSYALSKWNTWKVIIAYGTNDCQTASGASGWTSWPAWKAGYKANIQKFITAGWSASDICLITPPYCTNPALSGNLSTVQGHILDIATEIGAESIDWTQLCIDATKDAYTIVEGDGLHCDDAMHALLTTPAMSFINA